MKKSSLKEAVLFITGNKQRVKLQGKKEKVKAYLDVLMASKDLYEAVNQENITLNEIKYLVEKKKACAIAYKMKTSEDWVL